VHHYRRFIQDNLDSRGWKQADLVRASGLSRQLIHSILRDDRDHLGQMPDESTLEGLAKGFKVPLETVRTAAARSLVGYSDDGGALTPQLQDVDLDILLNEIRRRFHDLSALQTTPARASSEARKGKEAGSANDAKLGWSVDSDITSFPDGTEDEQHGSSL
jgi:transcriptional regulator with XRE-family HTH domain